MKKTKEAAENLPEVARQRIIGRLKRGELQPGSAISVRMLAEQLEMSTLTVTTALQALSRDGLVVSRNRSGSSIAVITPQDIWNMVQYRIALEQRSARIACRLATPEELRALLPLADAADGKGEPDEESWVTADDRFHQALQQSSHTAGLLLPTQYLQIFELKLRMCRSLQLIPDLAPNGARRVASGHRLIAEVANARDGERLSSLLELHIGRLIGLPELTSLQENADEKIQEIRTFLDRNRRNRTEELTRPQGVYQE